MSSKTMLDSLQETLLSKVESELQRNGFCYDSYTYLSSIAKIIRNHENKIRAYNKRYAKKYDNKVPTDVFNRMCDRLSNNLITAIYHYPKTENKVRAVNAKYKHMSERQFSSAISMFKKELKKWTLYDDPDMVAMFIQDVADHVRLAIALREGNVSKIDRYSNMDTSSREEIPNTVWTFICKLCCDCGPFC
jgi:hypothetical protein